MYELEQVGTRTYYIDCPAKMGLYRFGDTDVCLIDSGNDKDAARKVLKILQAQGWHLRMILNTHSHADHIGGNLFLQQRTGCAIYAPAAEIAFVQTPLLEPSFLYGGYPSKALRNKFLCAQGAHALPLTPDVLPQGLSMQYLNGHSFAMVGIHTDDDVWFVADSVTSEAILAKYHVSFLYDVAAYFESLRALEELQGRLFVPAHAQPTADMRPLIAANQKKAEEVLDLLLAICSAPTAPDDILAAVFAHYQLDMNPTQHALVGSTVRSMLSYLCDAGRVCATCSGNKLLWQTIDVGTP